MYEWTLYVGARRTFCRRKPSIPWETDGSFGACSTIGRVYFNGAVSKDIVLTVSARKPS
jgi:hypothetical protein